jgi:hypothetical protein
MEGICRHIFTNHRSSLVGLLLELGQTVLNGVLPMSSILIGVEPEAIYDLDGVVVLEQVCELCFS